MNSPGETARRIRGGLLPALFALGFSALFAARHDMVVPEIRAEQPGSSQPIRFGESEPVTAALEKKLGLLNTMLAGSLGKRIASSSNVRARQTMLEVREMFDEAVQSIERGDVDQAEQGIAKAFIKLSKASREVEDQGRVSELKKQEYERALERVQSFGQTYDQLISEGDTAKENQDVLDRVYFQSSQEEASQYARAENYVQATLSINKALQAIETALVKLQSSQTLIGSLDFNDPEVSYQYEKERNESNRRLLSIVIGRYEGDPDEEQRVGLINRMKTRADEQRALAELSARDGHFQAASRIMESANRTLVQAQHLSGFSMSQ